MTVNNVSAPPLFDCKFKITLLMFGAPNFHLYVTPAVERLQVMLTGDVLPASDTNVNPVGGNNKLKGLITALSFISFACYSKPNPASSIIFKC